VLSAAGPVLRERALVGSVVLDKLDRLGAVDAGRGWVADRAE
jgi:hypothetical protein